MGVVGGGADGGVVVSVHLLKGLCSSWSWNVGALKVICSLYDFSGDVCEVVGELVCRSWCVVECYWVVHDISFFTFPGCDTSDTGLFE